MNHSEANNFYDICEFLSKNSEEGKKLVHWYGDYAMYVPNFGVSREAIYQAYENTLKQASDKKKTDRNQEEKGI